MEERWKDQLARYTSLLARRNSPKTKERFIKALMMDILAVRQDVVVMAYGSKKTMMKNIYVGDVKRAKRILWTYYDTPPLSFGDVDLFDPSAQAKKTMWAIGLTSLVWIVLGLLGSLAYMRFSDAPWTLSIQSVIIVFLYGLYFWILSKIVKGEFFYRTQVRNTSSILALLQILSQNNDETLAFAFVDEGIYGMRGWTELKKRASKKAEIIGLDSIGADAPLYFQGHSSLSDEFEKNGIVLDEDPSTQARLFCASSKREGHWILSKEKIKKKEIDQDHIQTLTRLFCK